MDASVDPCEDFANFVCGNFYEVYENDSFFHSFNLQEELIYKQGKWLNNTGLMLKGKIATC